MASNPDPSPFERRLTAFINRLMERPFAPKRRPKPVSPQGLPYASFERRLLAAALDVGLLALLIVPFNGLLVHWAYRNVDISAWQALSQNYATHAQASAARIAAFEHGGLLRGMIRMAEVQFSIFAAYCVVFWHFYAATPGKLLLRMRIVDAVTGGRMTDMQTFLRIVGYAVASLPFGVGILSIQWNKKRQGWHDRLARTAVVVFPVKSGSEVAGPSSSPAPEASE